MKPHETTEIVMMLVAAFPATKADERTVSVYKTMLTDLEFDAAKAAVARLLTTCRFFPTIAEIRESEAAIRLGAVRPGGDAWGDVLEAIRRVGGYNPQPEFADPLVARCVSRFGWETLCWSRDDAADRARFIELYDREARTERVDVVSGLRLPRPPSGLACSPKALPQPQGPENALAPPRRASTGPTERVWTGRRLSQAELDAELGEAGGRG